MPQSVTFSEYLLEFPSTDIILQTVNSFSIIIELLTSAFSQLPVVRSEHVRTLFDSTQSQESKSEVCAQEFYAAMHIKTLLENALYLSSLVSDRSM